MFCFVFRHEATGNTPFGQLLGASANGRAAWHPLSDGISPTQGADYKNPTSSILGNGEMQFNYLDNEVLLDAQKQPEKYRDLWCACLYSRISTRATTKSAKSFVFLNRIESTKIARAWM